MQMDRKENRSDLDLDLDLTDDEINELEELLHTLGQELGEADPPMPDSLKSEALLPLLDGVEQEEPAREASPAAPEPRRPGRLIFGLFPEKYLAAAAMLAVAVGIGIAYKQMPRTPDIGVASGSGASADGGEAEESSSSQAMTYADVLYEINERYDRENKPVYEPPDRPPAPDAPDAGAEDAAADVPAPEEDSAAQKEAPQSGNREEESGDSESDDRRSPDGEEPDTAVRPDGGNPSTGGGSATRDEAAVVNRSDFDWDSDEPDGENPSDPAKPDVATGGSAEPEDGAAAEAAEPDGAVPEEEAVAADEAAEEEPLPEKTNPSIGVPETLDSGDGAALEKTNPDSGESAAAPAPESSAAPPPANSALRAPAVFERLLGTAEAGEYRYALYDRAGAGEIRVSDAASMQVGTVPLPSPAEGISYQAILSHGGRLVVIGTLHSYPEDYLALTETVYDEVGLQQGPAPEDRRNEFAEMVKISVYDVDEADPSRITERYSYYQSGSYRNSAVTPDGTLVVVTNKAIYGVNGVTEYMTESIPVADTPAGFQYLCEDSIHVDPTSLSLDSYAVIGEISLAGEATKPQMAAFLGDTMPVSCITEDCVYVASVSYNEETVSKIARFTAQDLTQYAETPDYTGIPVWDSRMSLPDGCIAVLWETVPDQCTGGGILEHTVRIFDQSLGLVAEAPVELDLSKLEGISAAGTAMEIRADGVTVTVDLSDPARPVVTTGGAESPSDAG